MGVFVQWWSQRWKDLLPTGLPRQVTTFWLHPRTPTGSYGEDDKVCEDG